MRELERVTGDLPNAVCLGATFDAAMDALGRLAEIGIGAEHHRSALIPVTVRDAAGVHDWGQTPIVQLAVSAPSAARPSCWQIRDAESAAPVYRVLAAERLAPAGTTSVQVGLDMPVIATWIDALGSTRDRFSIVGRAGRNLPLEVSTEATNSHCLALGGETVCVISRAAADALVQFLAGGWRRTGFPSITSTSTSTSARGI